MTEEQCTGEYEDEDVRNERSRVFRLTSNPQQSQQEEGPLAQPVVLVKVSKWRFFHFRRTCNLISTIFLTFLFFISIVAEPS